LPNIGIIALADNAIAEAAETATWKQHTYRHNTTCNHTVESGGIRKTFECMGISHNHTSLLPASSTPPTIKRLTTLNSKKFWGYYS